MAMHSHSSMIGYTVCLYHSSYSGIPWSTSTQVEVVTTETDGMTCYWV